jgi:hypothetical protein
VLDRAADGPDLLGDDAGGRTRAVVVVAGLLTLAVVLGGALVRAAAPPVPLAVEVAALDGSALAGDSFVRLHLQLRAQGASTLGDARLTVAGTSQRGVHRGRFDGRGRLTVQVDLTPTCGMVGQGVDGGSLDLGLRDSTGAERELRVPVPPSPRLERLVRYRCRDELARVQAAG